MADLAELSDLKPYLGDDSTGDDPLLRDLLDLVEELLEDETGQTFSEGGAVTNEAHDGTGASYLYLDRPPSALTADIKVGQDVDDPDDTIDQDDIVVDADNWRLIYLDGDVFPAGTRNIFVSYTASDNLPRKAKMAVLEVTAYLYRRRRHEHMTGASVGEFGSIEMLNAKLDYLPMWKKARQDLKLYRHV